jgi:hypothetical protein
VASIGLLHSRSSDLVAYRESLDQAALQALHDERFATPQARSVQQDFVRAEVTDDVARTLAIFNALLVQWRQAVAETGAEFHVVLLPTGQEDRFRDVIPRDFSVLSLRELMSAADADFRWEDVTFQHDGHWAELGNMLAASVLYPFTAQALGHRVLPPDALAEALRAYYSAFAGGWLPRGMEPLPCEDETLAPIRQKYLALELSASH